MDSWLLGKLAGCRRAQMTDIHEPNVVCSYLHLPLVAVLHDIQTINVILSGALVMQELLGLTTEQREQILAHRHIKLVSLARLVQERRELQVKLQVRNPCLSEQRLNQGSMLKLQSSRVRQQAMRLEAQWHAAFIFPAEA